MEEARIGTFKLYDVVAGESDFRNVMIKRAEITKTAMKGAKFVFTDMGDRHTQYYDQCSIIDSSDLSHVDIDESSMFHNVRVYQSTLDSARLSGRFYYCLIDRGDDKVETSRLLESSGISRPIDFSKARLSGTRFQRMDLRGANFFGVEMEGQTFESCHLGGVTFEDSKIHVPNWTLPYAHVFIDCRVDPNFPTHVAKYFERR